MLVGEAGFEPATLRLSGANTGYKPAALTVELLPRKVYIHYTRFSHICQGKPSNGYEDFLSASLAFPSL